MSGSSIGAFAPKTLGLNRSFNIAQNALKRIASGKAITNPANPQVMLARTALNRIAGLDLGNNRVTTQLRAANVTNAMLQHVQSLIQQMQGLAHQAMNASPVATPVAAAGAPAAPAAPSGAVGAFPTANIGRDTIVQGAGAGMVLSITSDSGQSFQYVFSGPTNSTTWGQVADAFNAANIGVTFRFDTANPASPRMSIEATDGSTGFRINANSGREIVNDLAGIHSAYDGAYNNTLFHSNGGSLSNFVAPTGAQGMTFGRGGHAETVRFVATPSAGSSVTFTGSDGVTRTWTAQAGDNSSSMANAINAMGGSVIAEHNWQGEIRLRDRDGAITISSGTGDFNPAGGVTRFETYAPPVGSPAPAPGLAPAPAAPPPPAASAASPVAAGLGQQFDTLKADLASLLNSSGMLGGPASQMIANLRTTLSGIPSGSNWGAGVDPARALASVRSLGDMVLETSAQVDLQTSRLAGLQKSAQAFGGDLKAFADGALAADLTGDSATAAAAQLQAQIAAKVTGLGAQRAKQLLRLLG
ncbi:MAG: hypothetical protein J0L51_14865 [Rhizobiales bacterium]|nr:hypothetical protein [Hyphomicrobiales bacterium]